MDPERQRLQEDARREKNWKRWGPYLAERQWGTVREDYSADGGCWDYFPHDQARSRAYRWGEDGLLGICDRQCRLCFAVALWNGRDPILKERLFGLVNEQGNHGEDVKEEYFYLAATPTASYLKAAYLYPQAAYPYQELIERNAHRGHHDREYELYDTGVFHENRYFTVTAEYAKSAPDEILIRLTVLNNGPETAQLHLLPTLWFRNSWIWGCRHEGCGLKPRIEKHDEHSLLADHESLGRFHFYYGHDPAGNAPQLLFTENETNTRRLFGSQNYTEYVKDAFHRYVVDQQVDAINPDGIGTKVAGLYRMELSTGQSQSIYMRLTGKPEGQAPLSHEQMSSVFDRRILEADQFYQSVVPGELNADEQAIHRQAGAGLIWTKQFYHYIVPDWLEGDPGMPPPPQQRHRGRNKAWIHMYCRDVISMPDKWEYPWFAAWDLAFHMIPFATIDPDFAKQQLMLFLREWYLHPNGQIPAYEFAFGDVNPPVHAWACWRVYKMTGPRGQRDRRFLESCFHKLLMNFTWWVNRKDLTGQNLFSGGFLGLDNIGLFDRSKPLPGGGFLQQADGTAWMAFYCGTMLAIALELAQENRAYSDMASKFFEHYVAIADAMNHLGGTGLWEEEDGFYYDRWRVNNTSIPLKVRSLVGLIPLIAVEVLEADLIDRLPGFKKRMNWFLRYRKDLDRQISYMQCTSQDAPAKRYLLAIPSRNRLESLLQYMLNETEFLSPYGIRSLSRAYRDHPYKMTFNGNAYTVRYEPGESETGLFGGISNWRGPIWFPINYLLIEALQRYHHFYGDTLRVEFPTGSGNLMTLDAVAAQLTRRLTDLFRADESRRRPFANGRPELGGNGPAEPWLLFHEYFHGDTGRGLGASHQTGWTALAARCIEELAREQSS